MEALNNSYQSQKDMISVGKMKYCFLHSELKNCTSISILEKDKRILINTVMSSPINLVATGHFNW